MNFKKKYIVTQKQILLMTAVIILAVSSLSGQKLKQDSTYKKCFIGGSLWILGNFFPDDPNPPGYVQLNLGYRITQKDVVSLEFKTWKYAWSPGIPYGKSFQAPAEKFPGYIREYGVALAYQRFLWKGVYTAIHVFNAKQTFVDNNGKK